MDLFTRSALAWRSLPMIALYALLNGQAIGAQPLRPPNGTYEYSMADAGSIVFKSTIVVKGTGSTFSISEMTKLPGGAIATTRSTWSSDTLLPLAFQLHQGKVTLRAHITRAALTFDGMRVSFLRIPGTSYVLPSVGLIATTLIYPYVVSAHPRESFTLAEIQNNQTVLVQPSNASPPPGAPTGDVPITVTKNEEYGKGADQERIVTWLSVKTGVMDAAQADPGGAKITLVSFKPHIP